jgi:hypothetical protein
MPMLHQRIILYPHNFNPGNPKIPLYYGRNGSIDIPWLGYTASNEYLKTDMGHSEMDGSKDVTGDPMPKKARGNISGHDLPTYPLSQGIGAESQSKTSVSNDGALDLLLAVAGSMEDNSSKF